jgi:hypothetical protein
MTGTFDKETGEDELHMTKETGEDDPHMTVVLSKMERSPKIA